MEILLLFVVDCAWMLPFAVIVWLFVKFVMVKRSPLKVVLIFLLLLLNVLMSHC